MPPLYPGEEAAAIPAVIKEEGRLPGTCPETGKVCPRSSGYISFSRLVICYAYQLVHRLFFYAAGTIPAPATTTMVMFFVRRNDDPATLMTQFLAKFSHEIDMLPGEIEQADHCLEHLLRCRLYLGYLLGMNKDIAITVPLKSGAKLFSLS